MKVVSICFLLSSFWWYKPVCAQQFNVQFSKKLSQKNFSGRAFIFLSKENKNPLNQDNWTRLQPVFAADVANLQANKSIIVNDMNAISFPVAITDMERGAYYATLLFDNNLGGRAIVSSPGNYISQTKQITFIYMSVSMYAQNKAALPPDFFNSFSYVLPAIFNLSDSTQEVEEVMKAAKEINKWHTTAECNYNIGKVFTFYNFLDRNITANAILNNHQKVIKAIKNCRQIEKEPNYRLSQLAYSNACLLHIHIGSNLSVIHC